MRLPTNPRELDVRLLRDICNQINALTEGNIHASHGALTAAPTTGSWNKGDFVLNSNPAETGTGGMKYIIRGWECVTAGAPGTWVEVRTLTGGGNDIVRFITASATLDFPSIGSNAMSTLTITATGAQVGDYVIARPPAAFESGFTFNAFVSAADTIKVRIHNNNGGAVDPASAEWSVLVFGVA